MSDQSRRKLLKSIAAGSGAIVAGSSLPENWTKPVVDSVMLPAHAATSPGCCAGVFCNLTFDDTNIGGAAQVNSNCTISMQGRALGQYDWSGSGYVAADGSFTFTIVFSGGPANQVVYGRVSEDCLSISGTMTGGWGNFTGTVNPGLTSISQC